MMDNFRKSLTARLTAIFLFPLLVITFFGIIYYWISQRSAGYDASDAKCAVIGRNSVLLGRSRTQ